MQCPAVSHATRPWLPSHTTAGLGPGAPREGAAEADRQGRTWERGPRGRRDFGTHGIFLPLQARLGHLLPWSLQRRQCRARAHPSSPRKPDCACRPGSSQGGHGGRPGPNSKSTAVKCLENELPCTLPRPRSQTREHTPPGNPCPQNLGRFVKTNTVELLCAVEMGWKRWGGLAVASLRPGDTRASVTVCAPCL